LNNQEHKHIHILCAYVVVLVSCSTVLAVKCEYNYYNIVKCDSNSYVRNFVLAYENSLTYVYIWHSTFGPFALESIDNSLYSSEY